MLYIIHCTDGPDATATRAATRDAHITYLNGQSAVIVLAGAALTEDGTPTGSHFIINVADRAAAEAFAAAHPFAAAGVFSATHISRLRKGFWFPENAADA